MAQIWPWPSNPWFSSGNDIYITNTDDYYSMEYIETIMINELQLAHCNIEDYMNAVLNNLKK